MTEILKLKNKKILISGALGLIGSKLTTRLIKNKNQVILIDYKINKKNKIYLKFKKKNIPIFDIDLKSKNHLQNFFKDQKKKLQGLNTVINLAAIDRKVDDNNSYIQSEFYNFDYNVIRDSVDNNLLGTVNMCQESCKFFINNKIKKANIINVASTYSIVAPNPLLYANKKNKPIDYVISKGSIPILTKYIAVNYAKKNIRCNCIVPHAIIENPPIKFLDKFKKLSPIGRTCKIEEVLDPLIFLISDGSSYMNGSIVTVDGGWTAW